MKHTKVTEEVEVKRHRWVVVPGPDTDFCVRLMCKKCKDIFEQDMYSIAPETGCKGEK